MYELFTGQRPFEGTDEEVLEHHRRSKPQSPRQLNKNICCSLEHLILKLLDKDPNKRYATARRVRRILEGIIPPVSSEDLAPFARLPLVGRKEPMQRLTDLWAKTQQGHGQLVLITGEVGIGKTRLTQELTQHVGQAVILTGACQPGEDQMPYQPFVDALQSHLNNASPDDAGLEDPVRLVLNEMMHWAPEIYHVVSQPGMHPAAMGSDNDLLTEHPSLAKTIARTTKKEPWLLILDDLHLADPATLHLLHYLGRHCNQMGLMIVGTYAIPNNETNVESLTQFLADLKDYTSYTSLTLEPLSQNDVQKLLESSSGQDVPLDLVSAIFRRTQGNPLFVNEVTLSLIDEGVVSQRDGKWRLSSVVEGELPQDLTEAIMRRFNRLHKETQTLLYQAATLGLTFDFTDLHEMSDLSRWDALDNLEFALERQLIRVVPHQSGLRFKHSYIRRVLYNNLGQLKRRLMHREAGEALERCHTDTSAKAAVLANHFWHAEILDNALSYSKQAARQAEIIYASETALFWYNRALEILAQFGEDDETVQEQFELLLARERVHSRMGQRKAQAADLVAMQALVQENPARQAGVHNRRAAYERTSSRLAQAAIEAEAAQKAAQEANDAAQEGESLIQLGYITLAQGNFDTAQQYFERAKEIADETNQRAEARAMNGLATTYTRIHDYAQAEDTYQHALTMNREIGRWSGQAAVLTNLGILYLQVGDYVDALALLQQALEVNRLIGHRRGEAICLHHLALANKALGIFDEAETYLQTALAIRQDIEDLQGKAEDRRALGSIELDRADFTKAREYIGQALEQFQSLKIGAFEGDTWLVLGLALEGLNDQVKAKHAYEQAQLLHKEINNEAGVIEARAGIARCWLAEGQPDEAKAEIDECLAWMAPHGGLGIHDPVQLYLTAHQILAAAGDKKSAAKAKKAGKTFIQQRAEKIRDLGLRASYLENVHINKTLLQE
jgi:predicted ATPase